MKYYILYYLISFGIFSTQAIQGQNLDKSFLESTIDSLVTTEINDTTPGVVIGIVKKGELIFSKGYGLANLSYGIPNDSKKVYNLGSTSKQFLGYAFAMLHVKGELNIDDPVNKYLEDWPEFEHKVTLRNLLSHTSGYREAYTMSYLAGRPIGEDRLSKKECLEVVRRQTNLEFEPGTRYTYNSTAWIILAEVLEKVTGKPADKWVEINIFQPLGMNDTQIESEVGELIYNAAESYYYDQEHGYINQRSNRAIFGAADVYSSIEDLVKWINNYRTSTIGGEEVNNLFFESFKLKDGTDSEYGLGIRIDLYNGLRRYKHTGSHESFYTQLSYYPDHDLGIIIIENFASNDGTPEIKIAELFLKEHMVPQKEISYKEVEINKELLKKYEGLYMISSNIASVNLEIIDNKLTLNGRTKLIPISQTTFQIEGENENIQFEILANGHPQFTFSDLPGFMLFVKVEVVDPSIGTLENYIGDYWSEELETMYHVELTNKNLKLNHRWLGDIELEPISEDLFRSSRGFYVKFNRNKAGEISNFSISKGRTLNVVFNLK